MFGHFRKNQSFLSHLIAYGASEVVSKLSRLFVVIMVARHLGVEQIGLAAAALAVCDILKSLTENGIGQKVIAAPDNALAAVVARAHSLFWQTSLGLFSLQIVIGGLFSFFGNPLIGGLIALAALEYLFMPGGLVQAALAMREGKLSKTAAISGTQVVAANALSVALVFLFPSALVLVLPRVLTAPIWLVAMRRLRPWQPDNTATPAPLKPFVTFGMPVVCVSVVNALRLHADKLVIGALLGAEGLGAYFMAFNAGLSIATSFVAAFDKVVFPHLSRAIDLDARQIAFAGLIFIAPVVFLQSLLAPVYVPFLLGQNWAHISPVVSILCLSVLPLTLWSTAAAQLRIKGRPDIELAVTLALTTALLISAIPASDWGLFGLATAHLCVVTMIAGIGSIPILWPRGNTPFKQEI